ncbi:hypothetical protein RAC69_14460 [Microbacterium sp. LS_15]|uniref:hypothetical protein n=1 Tax=Microbacterium sp. LS_15 TaxID=3055790 RepID=UPI0035BF14F7
MTVVLTATDQSGYQITDDDLRFLGITRDCFDSWARGETPLAVSPADYVELRRTLFDALRADGIDDADVRLQGSAARFFSSLKKPMLYTRAELVQEFANQHQRLPSQYETSRMEERLASRWAESGPKQRPFDALYVIGAAKEESDLDFQVSSDAAKRLIESAVRNLRISPDSVRAKHEDYNFFEKYLTESQFIRLSLWRTRASEMIRRPVSVAIFDAAGPPVSTGPVSSHFQATDWMVNP